jgi:hypothetical protein
MVIMVADLLHDPACADNDWDEDDEFVDDVRNTGPMRSDTSFL